MASRFLVLLVATVASALTVGCTGDDGEPEPAPSGTAALTVPTLATAWTAETGARWQPGTDDSAPAWTTPTTVVVPSTRELSAYAAASGASQWTTALPQPLCAIADSPNAAGVAGFLMGSGDRSGDGRCAVAGAIDVNTGKLLWTKSLPPQLTDVGVDAVQTGPDAVTFTNTCNSAVSLSVRTGAVRTTFPPNGTGTGGCRDSFAGDGRVIVDGHERYGRSGADAVVGYDAVSGRRLWAVPVAGTAAFRSPNIKLHSVVSSDPLVIDAEINGHRFLRAVDTKARRLTIIGRQIVNSYSTVFTDVRDGVLRVQYGASRVLFAYDARSGAQLRRTVLGTSEIASGVRGDDVLTVSLAEPAPRSDQRFVRGVDPATGARRILGRLGRGAASVLGVAANSVLVAGTDRVVAYRAPTRALPVGDLPDPVRWAPGDLTPRALVELCLGVTGPTKRALGFVEPDLPIPASCDWVESLAGGATRQVNTTAWAIEPTARSSAVARAHRTVVDLMKPDTTNGFLAMTRLRGLGDEAGIVVAAKGRAFVRVVVRRANVVLVLDLAGSVARPGGRETVLLTRGARLVAADLVAEIDRRR